MKIKFTLLLTLFFLCNCKKDVGKLPVHTDTTPVIVSPDFVFKDCKLLTQPATGWRDTSLLSEKNLDWVRINPVNTDEVIYSSQSILYNYNTKTKARKTLYTNTSGGCFDINKYGWVIFFDIGARVFKIKVDGDSLSSLNLSSFNVFWDNTGKYIYYSIGNDCFKVDDSGNNRIPVSGYVLGTFKNSNKIIGVKLTTNELFIRNMDTASETIIYKGVNSSYFFLSLDNNDENFYWSSGSIIRFNIAALKLDTLLKACPGATPQNLANANSYVGQPSITHNSNKLSFINRVFIPTSTNKGYTEVHALQMDLTSKKIAEIKIFE